MSLLNTDFLVSALSGCEVLKKSEFQFKGVGIDTRKDLKDKVFFAIKGKRFDGHDFLSTAWEQGARAFIVSDLEKSRFLLEPKGLSLFLAPDTVTALGKLAGAWRREMELKVIGITGSNGKTSVCSFAKTLLSDLSPFVSPKSYNNAIGVPLSLLAVQRKKAVLIQEIGASRPGEIAFLTKLCQPDISALTMVGASHLEGFKSLAGVAEEKKNIYLKSPSAIWIFNKDNPWTKSMADQLCQTELPPASNQSKALDSFSDSRQREQDDLSLKKREPAGFKSAHFSGLDNKPSPLDELSQRKGSGFFSFSSKERDVDVSLKIIKREKDHVRIGGRIGAFESQAKVPLYGRESLENLMCASAIALAVGAPAQRIWEKLPECRSPKGRQESFFLKEKNISLCFDAYNANPSSMEFFLNRCEQASGGARRLLILGDMKELGEHSEKYHRDLSAHKALLSSRAVFFVGENSSLIEEGLKENQYQGFFKSFEAYSAALSLLVKKRWKKGDFIGIKASRSLGLEQLFFDLTGKKIF